MEEMWIVRDKENYLWLALGPEKPKKEKEQWEAFKDIWLIMNNNLFPEVKWSDEEPTKVKLVIEK